MDACVQSVFGELSQKSPPSNIFFKCLSYIFLKRQSLRGDGYLYTIGLRGPEPKIAPQRQRPAQLWIFYSYRRNTVFQVTSIPSTIDLVRGKTTSFKLCSALPKYMILPAMPDNKAFSSCVVKRPLQFLQAAPAQSRDHCLPANGLCAHSSQFTCAHNLCAHVNYQKHILYKH